MELKDQLAALQTELKSHFEKAADESKLRGSMAEETKKTIDALQLQVDAIDVKLAGRHGGGGDEIKSFHDVCKEDESVQRLMKDRRGVAVVNLKGRQVSDLLGYKTTITSSAVGVATTGVLQIDRIAGITQEARQALTIRNLLYARPTAMQVIDYVKVNAKMAIASPQTEASDKAQNAVTFTSASENVQTLATWIPATRQILDDFSELSSYLNSALPYYVNLEEELQLLSGSGSGTNLHGLIPQATAFDTTLTSAAAGWNKIDLIGRALQQIATANEIAADWVVMNPIDWWGIRLTKDSFGRYILGDPQSPVPPNLFGKPVVPTTSIASGKFLVGNGQSVSAEIRDRMEMAVEISTEHSDYFIKNMVAIRAEKRLALVVKRAASYIYGTFTTSP